MQLMISDDTPLKESLAQRLKSNLGGVVVFTEVGQTDMGEVVTYILRQESSGLMIPQVTMV